MTRQGSRRREFFPYAGMRGNRMKRVGMAVGAWVLLAAPAWAEEKVIQEADKVVVRKKTIVDFSSVNVEGDLTKPEGSYVLDRRKSGFPSRIKVRASFAPELQKSADNL